MKPQKLTQILTLIIAIGLLPNAQAVIPPPDGGYPGFNTAEGQNALLSLAGGGFANTAVGWFSLANDIDNDFNTAVGAGSLLFNQESNNTAVGAAALLFNEQGSDNTAMGVAALLNNTASGNTAIGSNALANNTTGGSLGNIQGVDFGPNVAVGWQALGSNTVASANTAVGYQALQSFTTGPVGFEQLGLCTAVGFQALANATGSGAGNNAFGYHALMNNTEGAGNTAIGLQALLNNTTGGSNVAIGNNALSSNTSGDTNIANGFSALTGNTEGSNNIAIGFNALGGNSTGDGNIAVGGFAGVAVATASNVICIGTNVSGQDVSDSCYIGNIFGSTTSMGSTVFVNSSGRLGTSTSSQRFKERIRPMDKTSETLFALEPVTFRYKKEIDPAGTSHFGLVAEDVEKVNPDLVVRDKEGKPYSVRYDQVNAMLLNEFLKEHRQGEEQDLAIKQLKSMLTQQQKRFESKLAQQEQQIAALMADLRRLAADIELNKAESQALAEK